MINNHGHCDGGKLALAIAITSGIFYSLCSAFVAFMPQQALKLAASVKHLTSLEQFAPLVKVTLPGFIIGLVAVFIATYLFVLLAHYIFHVLHKGTDLHQRTEAQHNKRS